MVKLAVYVQRTFPEQYEVFESVLGRSLNNDVKIDKTGVDFFSCEDEKGIHFFYLSPSRIAVSRVLNLMDRQGLILRRKVSVHPNDLLSVESYYGVQRTDVTDPKQCYELFVDFCQIQRYMIDFHTRRLEDCVYTDGKTTGFILPEDAVLYPEAFPIGIAVIALNTFCHSILSKCYPVKTLEKIMEHPMNIYTYDLDNPDTDDVLYGWAGEDIESEIEGLPVFAEDYPVVYQNSLLMLNSLSF